MDWRLILEFLVVAGALAMGARMGGVGLGLWGAVGLLVLVVGFDVAPANIPGEVLFIVLTVIMAASAMEVAGGIDFLVRLAERIIRKNPKQITIIAPLVTYAFTFAAGTGHIVSTTIAVAVGLLIASMTEARRSHRRCLRGNHRGQASRALYGRHDPGGAGTSTNMNANEVIANRALELPGHRKGEYQYLHPNDHVNCSQSTNDVYPTAVKLGVVLTLRDTVSALREFQTGLKAKAAELLKVNMGATAIGTGINSPFGYAELCRQRLAEISGLPVTLAGDLVEATQDSGEFALGRQRIPIPL